MWKQIFSCSVPSGLGRCSLEEAVPGECRSSSRVTPAQREEDTGLPCVLPKGWRLRGKLVSSGLRGCKMSPGVRLDVLVGKA